ncbi:thermonuclease family protein [Radiobacillus kanasensis]|uniref:thermonuclease family protein n=1 Tax=Radiobacillus kanasensis TaxID=2844358 RepID=UPI001E5F1EB3|nr:thermonuclease family protein [Radiobacillus kanasensis]UFT99277.1 thermonuclease family protein [Radiobacillus kanasensis]
MKKWTSLLLIFTLIFSSLFSTSPLLVSAAEQPSSITVAEALATPQRTEVTMTGYIVAGFNGQYAVEVADSTEATESIIVKLESDQRSQFSPENNPDALHQQIVVTGTRDVYSNQESIEYVSSISFVQDTTPDDPTEGDTITIAQAREVAAGQTVTVQGIITANGSKTFIQDDTAGINLYSPASSTSLSVGDLVKVTGEREDYNGLQEISNYTVEVLSSGESITPQTVTIDQINEEVEGELIRLENVTIGPINTNENTFLEDGNGNSIAIYQIPSLANISTGDVVNVTAIGSEFNGTYQLHVENAEDVEFVSEGSDDNGDPNTYEATVTSVVDGDTIHFEPAIYGSDTVRYVNIDTPETFHLSSYHNNLINTDPDHAQKYHGELAKEHLKSLLQPGDEITLKVGEEVTDDYGRVLAQVIRKTDGLNTNLEMVKQGFASTYFIWPAGDMETYSQFQAAVKQAKDNSLGIWSETNTDVLELPFVFRARYDGSGLSRYVGNSETKQYYEPENWASVPVEKRIFFSEEEAIANGYTPAFERNSKIADARYAPVGNSVSVSGIVTYISESNYYIQDETAGIIVRSSHLDAEVGDLVTANGSTSEYQGMLQVVTEDVELTKQDVGEPSPNYIQATDLRESTEGTLVALENVTVESVDNNHNYAAKDGYGNSFLIDSDSDLVETGKIYDTIIGVVDYNSNEFKLLPRSSEDIIADIPVRTIAEARAAELDTKVQIEGIVTAINGQNYYVQDDTAGIVVRVEEPGFTAEIGDKIRAKARTEEYFGLLEMIPTLNNVSVVEAGIGTPEPKLITSSDMNEELEGQLVVMKNVTVNAADDHGNYQASDAQGSLVIDNDEKFIKTGTTYEQIIGVLDYNYDEYKIMPRSVEDVTVKQVEPDLSTIADARNAEQNSRVKVEGIVTAVFDGMAYIQDESAGIALYGSEVAANVGDKVQVIGNTKEYYGLSEIVDFEVDVLEEGVGTPDAKRVTSTDLGESLEGQLVTVTMVTIDSEAGHGEYLASDETGEFVLDNNSFVEIGKTYESITGVITYDFGAYKLIPRTEADVVAYTPAPEQMLLDTLLSGDKSKAKEVAAGFIELVESDTLTNTEVSELIEEALLAHSAQDYRTKFTIKRVSLQVEILLALVERDFRFSMIESIINYQAEKRFARIIERDIYEILEVGQKGSLVG